MRLLLTKLSLLLLGLAPMILGAGCKGRHSQVEVPPSAAFESDTGQRSGAQGVVTGDPSCMSPQEITEPARTDPEFPIAEVYRAALEPDSAASRARFEAQFIPKKDSQFLSDQQWPRIRTHVRKYVQDPKKFSFWVCRRDVKGDDREKIFVRSFDSRKSNPPIIVVKRGDRWFIDFFSY